MAEGTEVGTAYVSITPSAAGFGAKLQSQISGEAATAGTAAGKALGGGMTTAASGLVKGIGGILAAAGTWRFLQGAVAEAEDAARVGRLTEAVIKSTGGAAGVTAAQVEKLAGSLSEVAGVDDEVVQGAENVLLTFTRVSGQIFPQATAAALDMSAALGTDLQGSVIQLGKALNDPVQGMTALRRVGVSFTADQVAQVKALQQTGDLLGAQKLILAEVNTEFGGAAAAGATATAKFGVAIGNLKESLGTLLLPAVNVATGGLGSLMGEITDAPGPMRTMAGAAVVLAGGITVAGLAVGLLGPRIRDARSELEGLGLAGTKASGALGLLGKAAGLLTLMEGALQFASLFTPKVKDMDEKVAALAATTDGKLNKAFHDTAEEMSKWDAIGATSLLPKKMKTEFDTFNKVLESGNFALAQRVIASEDDVEVRGRLQTAYDKAIGSTRQLNTDQALSAKIISGVGDAVEDTTDKIAEGKKAWDDLSGTLEDLIATDWSKNLASNFKSALNPLEKFTFNAGKDIAGLKDQVATAKTDLDKATADLAKIEVTGTAADIARIRGNVGDIDAARAEVSAAAGRFTETKKKLAEAEKSPLSTISENLQTNLTGLTKWLTNIQTLTKGGHESLAKHLADLGPQAADAMAEAVGVSPKQLNRLEGLFDQADLKVAEAASGQFELNLDQTGKPGETLAEIITARYEKSLIPGFTQATLSALNIATAAILGGEEGKGISFDVAEEPGPGEARRPPAPYGPVGPAVPQIVAAPAPGPAPLINVPGFTMPTGGLTIQTTVNARTDANPREIAGETADQIAWRLAPRPTLVG